MAEIQVPVDLGFTEFVTSLLSEVVRSIAAAQNDQEQRLAELAAAAAMTLEEFDATHVTEPDVDVWLADRFPSSDLEQPHVVYSGAPYEPASDEGPEHPPFEEVLGIVLTGRDVNRGRGRLLAAGVTKLRAAARQQLAREEHEVTRQLVERGLPRVVVDAGRIRAKLTFEALRYREETEVDADPIEEAEDGGGFDDGTEPASVAGPGAPLLAATARPRRTNEVLMAGRLAGLRQATVIPQVLHDVRLRVHTADDRKPETSARANVYGEVELTFKTIS